MLDLVRRKQKSVLIKVAFAIIILSFVIGYAMLTSPGGPEGSDPTVAATVNGTRIDYNDFQGAYSNLYRLYQEIYREQFTPAMEKQLRLRQQALDALIEQALLVQEAERLGLSVSQQELVESIAEIPAFQENGAFSRDRYLQVLNYQRLTPEAFEQMQKRQLLVEKVREKIQEGVAVTAEEIVQEYKNRNEKVNLSFVRLAPAQFEDQVRVEPAALEDYFTGRKEEFRVPEQASLRYVTFDPRAYLDDVTFDEGELEKYYRRHLDRFEVPEQVKASHILLKVPQNADAALKEKKREQARKIMEEAKGGADFADLARKYSEDAGSAAQGGDLGFFSRGTMVPPFEQVAFALQPGEISSLVETPFGFHVIKAEDRIDAGVRPMAEVIEEVRAGLRTEKAGQLAYEKAMDAYNMNRQGGSLEKAAEAEGLEIRETGLFDRQGPADGLGEAPEVIAAAFDLQAGELGRPVKLPQGVVLVAGKERRESRLPELQEVRGEVEQLYRRDQARKLAQKAAEDVLAGLRAGKDLPAMATTHGAKVEETGLFTRAYGSFIPRLGSSEELATAAFELTSEQPTADRVFEQDGRYVVIRLQERQEADTAALDQTQRDELRETLLAEQKSEAVQNRLQELRSGAEITIAPTIANSLEGENT